MRKGAFSSSYIRTNFVLKCKVRAWPLQLNLRELACVIHQKCAAISQEYMHRHRLSMSTRYLAIDATPGPVFTKLFQNKDQDQAQVKNSSLYIWIVFKTSYNYLKYYYAHI